MKNLFTKLLMSALFITVSSGYLFPQHHDENDDRRTPIIIDKNHELINKIKEKLDDLDAEYLSRLHQREYVRAKRDLNKIYHMIDELDKQQTVEVAPPLVAIPESDYNQLVNSINNESFEENKIAVLQSSAKYNYFSVEQIMGLMDLSTFSSWKLKALEITYPFVVDGYNSFKIINALTFSEDKQKAKSIIDNN